MADDKLKELEKRIDNNKVLPQTSKDALKELIKESRELQKELDKSKGK